MFVWMFFKIEDLSLGRECAESTNSVFKPEHLFESFISLLCVSLSMFEILQTSLVP